MAYFLYCQWTCQLVKHENLKTHFSVNNPREVKDSIQLILHLCSTGTLQHAPLNSLSLAQDIIYQSSPICITFTPPRRLSYVFSTMPIQGCHWHSTDLSKSQDERETHHQLTQHLASPVGFILPMSTKIEFFAGPISFLPSSITLPHLSLSGISVPDSLNGPYVCRYFAGSAKDPGFASRTASRLLRVCDSRGYVCRFELVFVRVQVSETSCSQRPICRLTWSAAHRVAGFTCTVGSYKSELFSAGFLHDYQVQYGLCFSPTSSYKITAVRQLYRMPVQPTSDPASNAQG
ncbi:hypothetical protein R3P38DRAFT_116801 [Favolaschia claudopus]|uniref:Uncharacterized protein n=1 Tax=Favolaschia claudopus TaxID=2862362 RepID=A0AAV9ZX48_9AGAR